MEGRNPYRTEAAALGVFNLGLAVGLAFAARGRMLDLFVIWIVLAVWHGLLAVCAFMMMTVKISPYTKKSNPVNTNPKVKVANEDIPHENGEWTGLYNSLGVLVFFGLLVSVILYFCVKQKWITF